MTRRSDEIALQEHGEFAVGDVIRFKPGNGYPRKHYGILTHIYQNVSGSVFFRMDGDGGWLPYRFDLVKSNRPPTKMNSDEYEEILAGQAIMDAINKPQTGY